MTPSLFISGIAQRFTAGGGIPIPILAENVDDVQGRTHGLFNLHSAEEPSGDDGGTTQLGAGDNSLCRYHVTLRRGSAQRDVYEGYQTLDPRTAG